MSRCRVEHCEHFDYVAGSDAAQARGEAIVEHSCGRHVYRLAQHHERLSVGGDGVHGANDRAAEVNGFGFAVRSGRVARDFTGLDLGHHAQLQVA